MAEKLNRPDVIIIGGNHHNPLGVVRSFGVNGIRPYGIIVVGKDKNSFVTKSRYWKKTWLASTDAEAIEIMKNEFSDQNQKPVVIPCSDSIAMEIDLQLDELKERFILPSMGERQGAIAALMDKHKQVEFCEKNGLLMAKSWIIDLRNNKWPEDINYPVFFKPVTSAEGVKLDIRRCDDKEEAQKYSEVLRDKGYKRFLLQEYIPFDRELEFVGSTADTDAFIISENIREWPLIGGTNSFFVVKGNIELKKCCFRILEAMKQNGFSGCFDVELFDYKGEIYVNEFNWRNTGNSFFALGTNVHYAVIWYLSKIGEDTSLLKHTTDDEEQYAMNEATDTRHLLCHNVSFLQWFSDLKTTQSFALWFSKDPIPAIFRYVYLICELFKRRGAVCKKSN